MRKRRIVAFVLAAAISISEFQVQNLMVINAEQVIEQEELTESYGEEEEKQANDKKADNEDEIKVQKDTDKDDFDGNMYIEGKVDKVAAVSAKSNVNYEYTRNSTTNQITITKYTGDETKITIPSSIDGYKVEGIGDNVFRNLDNLTSVEIPEGVKTIGNSAFYDCNSLSEIKLPESLKTIGNYAFWGCEKLKGIQLKEGIQTIGSDFIGNTEISGIVIPKTVESMSYAFSNAKELKKAEFSEGIKKIPDYAFAKNYNGTIQIEQVVIPEGVIEIGRDTFYDCDGLKEVKLPESLKTIGQSAFYDCDSLKEMKLSASLETIGQSAFYDCDSLTGINLPESLKTIGQSAFCDCDSLKAIEFPKKLKSIGDSAFSNCGSLTEIEIPGNVETIGNYAFWGCEKLKNIQLKEGIQTIGSDFIGNTEISGIVIPKTVESMSYAFSNAKELKKAEFSEGIKKIPDYAFAKNYNGTMQIEQVVIPEGVIEIGRDTFYDCDGLKEVKLPESLKTIGQSAFYDCDSLTGINLPESLKTIGQSAFYDCDSLKAIEFPKKLKSIGDSAFSNCGSLTEIEIPGNVETIGNYAFRGCEKLKSIQLKEGIQTIGSDFIGNTEISGIVIPKTVESMSYAFSNAKELKKAEFSEGIKKIPDYAFAKNYNGTIQIEQVVIPEGVIEIGRDTFYDCDGLKEVKLPESLKTIGQSAFYDCDSLKAIEFPKKLKSIGDSAFSNCGSLTEIEIPGNVETIGNYAFRGCEKLKSIQLKEGIQTIGSDFIGNTEISGIVIPKTVESMSYAFSNAKELKKAEFSEGIKKIPDYAFAKNYNGTMQIEQVVIPEGVIEIGRDTFYDCDGLKEVKLPESLKTIGQSAFYDCDSLKAIEFPKKLKSIGDSAFSNCGSLTEIEIPGNVETIGNYAFRGCEKLKSIQLKEGIQTIGSDFIGNTEISGIVIPKTVESMSYAFSNAKELKKAEFSEGIKKIPDYAFAKNYNGTMQIEQVVIPEGVIEIGRDTFYDCDGLKEVKLPESLKTIGQSAFYDCDSLAEIKFPDNVEIINDSAFSGCEILQTIKLSKQLKTIGSSAFQDCANLAGIEIPANLETIGSNAFFGCESLTSIQLNEGIKTLGTGFISGTSISEIIIPKTVESMRYAFDNAKELKTVTFSQGIVKIPDYAFAKHYNNSYELSIQEINIPKNVSEVGYSAFTGFSGNLNLVSEDCAVAIYAIDNERTYTAKSTGILDKSGYYLARNNTSYYMGLSTSTTSGYVNLNLQYDFKKVVQNKVDTSNMKLKIKIPSASILVSRSFKINGSEYAAEADNNGYIYIPVESLKGTASFSLQISDISYLMTYAQIEFYDNSEHQYHSETLGIVNMAKNIFLLNVPADTAESTIHVIGFAEPEQLIDLYLEDNKVTTVKSSKAGSYTADIEISNPQENTMYKIEAKSSWNNEDYSVTAYTNYTKNAVEVTECTMYFRNQAYDLIKLSGKRPVITWASGNSFTFKIAFNDNKNVGDVQVVSRKNGEVKRLDAVWNEDQQVFVASGFYGYVPGNITIEYGNALSAYFEDCEVNISNAYENEGTSGYESKVNLKGVDTFHYLKEQETNIAQLPNSEFEKSEYEGVTCYLAKEMTYKEKDDKVYRCQELYILQEDGTYNLLRMGVGVQKEQVSGQNLRSIARKNDGLEDYVEKLDNLMDFLTNDVSKDPSNEKVYAWLTNTIETAKQVVEPGSKEAYELTEIEIELKIVKMMGDTQTAFNQLNKVIDSSSDFSDLGEFDDLADMISDKMKDSVDIMKDCAKKVENRHLSEIIKKLTKGGFAKKSLMDRINDILEKKIREANLNFNPKYSIDPSGYVYEAVMDNRLSGATVTIYYKDSESGEAVLWDAEEYEQENPLFTDKDGMYAWDVPEGLWQVKVEKKGYKTAYSDWLPVPPPQLDVNIGMVATEKPKVESLAIYPDHAKIIFSQYIAPDTLSGLQITSSDGKKISYTLEYNTESKNAEGVRYAREYILKFSDGTVLNSETSCKVVFDGNVKSYTGMLMEVGEQEIKVQKNIEIIAPNEVTVKMGQILDMDFSITNRQENMKILVVSEFDEIAKVQSIGQDKISILGNLLGETEITLSIEGTQVQKTIKVNVGKTSEAKTRVNLPKAVYQLSVGESVEIIPEIYPDTSLEGEWSIIGEEGIVTVEENIFTAKASGEVVLRYTLKDYEDAYAECQFIVKEQGEAGDINGDGDVNTKDAVLLKKYLAEYTGLNINLDAADVNGDGEVNTKDAVRLLQYLAGYNVTLGK